MPFVLSEKDHAQLKELLDWWRNQRISPVRQDREEQDGWPADVFVARTPVAGIPALSEAVGSSVEDQPGSAECDVYRIIDDKLLPVSGFSKTVHNIYHDPLGGNRWFILARTKFGRWIATTPFPSPDVTDTGTGTGIPGGGGAGTITVEEEDGSPSVDASVLRFDGAAPSVPAQALVVDEPASGEARLRIADADTALRGLVSAAKQSFGGLKNFDDDLMLPVQDGSGATKYLHFGDFSQEPLVARSFISGVTSGGSDAVIIDIVADTPSPNASQSVFFTVDSELGEFVFDAGGATSLPPGIKVRDSSGLLSGVSATMADGSVFTSGLLTTDGGGLGGGGGMTIGNTVSGGTAGSFLFVDGSGNLAQDNSNLFWSTGDLRLGIGTASPDVDLHVLGHSDATVEVETTGAGDVSTFLLTSHASAAAKLTFNDGADAAVLAYDHGTDELSITVSMSDLAVTLDDTSTIFGDGTTRITHTNGWLLLNATDTDDGALIFLETASAASVGQIIKGSASQSADLQQWRKSDDTVLLAVDDEGNLVADGSTGVSGSRSDGLTTVGGVVTALGTSTGNPDLTDGTTTVNDVDTIEVDPDFNLVADEGSGNASVTPINRQRCDGRLTTQSGTPVTTGDRSNQSTLYYTPYVGNRVSLYNTTSGEWDEHRFTQRSIALSGLTANTNYDLFLYDNSGTLTLEVTAWTNDTTRATALTRQDGVLVKSGSADRRYLGTFRATDTNETQDTKTQRFLWNYYHRVPRCMEAIDATSSWSYNSGTWRSKNNSTSNRLEVVVGVAENPVTVSNWGYGSANGYIGVGKSKTNGNDATSMINSDNIMHAFLDDPLEGYAYYQAVERTTTSVTFYGTFSSQPIITSIRGSVLG